MPPKGKSKASTAVDPLEDARRKRKSPGGDDEHDASRSAAASPVGGGDRPTREADQRRGVDDGDDQDEHEGLDETNPRAMARGVTHPVGSDEANPRAIARGVTHPIAQVQRRRVEPTARSEGATTRGAAVATADTRVAALARRSARAARTVESVGHHRRKSKLIWNPQRATMTQFKLLLIQCSSRCIS